ncbi:hypothetical protein [Oceanobacillus sojae]|uniref:Replication protein n=1 Tax=Oceanobacillus sojae TaxID=582851 RepID=A0A511ZIF3_9BACI|nr:hypothetical protein [Oceanobacillus sojae]GEN87217.1 hypothetical protein OSO01_19560 [Oceanobacillus sojae]
MNKPKIPGGYILLSRKVIESEIWDKPPLYLKVWIYILSKTQHSAYKNLKRGQVFISIPEIIEACSYKVGFRIEKPTKKQIFGIIDWLRNPYEGNHEGNNEGPMIVTTKVTHGMVVEVCNYNVYQDPKNYEGNSESHTKVTTKELRREREGNNNNKNVKNDKNVKKNKELRSKLKFETHHLKLAELLFKKIKENNPNANKPNLESWADTFRKMMEIDKKSGKEIQDLILWSQQNHFWHMNILSAGKLRKQFNRLSLEMKEDQKPKSNVVQFNKKEAEDDGYNYGF